MNCTKCTTPILKAEKFHRTKKGPHHAKCPHVSVAIPNGGGPAVVTRDDKHGHATWECGAHKQGTVGGNAPGDCNWPFCGCDPYAEKVIAAIQESGYEIKKLERIGTC